LATTTAIAAALSPGRFYETSYKYERSSAPE